MPNQLFQFTFPLTQMSGKERRLWFTAVPNLPNPSTTSHKQRLVSNHNGICVICNFLLIIRLGQRSPRRLMPHKTFIALLDRRIIYQYQTGLLQRVDNSALFYCIWLLLMSTTSILKEVITFK